MVVTRDYAGGFGVAAHSSRRGYGHWKWSVPYVSLMYSAGVLAREGHEIAYIDAQAERLDASDSIAKIRSLRPEIIIAVVNLPSLSGDGRLLHMLKNEVPDSRLICIGTVCKVLPEYVAEQDFADILVLGEPEVVIPSLVARIRDNDGINSVNNIAVVSDGDIEKTNVADETVDLESLPWPPYDIMPTTRYRDPFFGKDVRFLPMWASRGCPMPCSYYCPYPLGLGSTVRLRSCEDVVEEMSYLSENFGISGYIFRDQLFTMKEDRAEEISDLILDRKLKVRWLCETRFDLVSENLLRKMRKAGCREIHFGLETGDPDLLRKIGKPGMEISTVREAIKLTKKAGIRPMTHIILGLPGETPQTVRTTLATLRETGVTRASVNVATPYPGTAFFKYALKKGLLETRDWTKFTSFNRVMRTESMSSTELEEWAMFLNRNLLGRTPAERMLYLCKNKAIIDSISDFSSRIREYPLAPFHFVRHFLSTRDFGKAMQELRRGYDTDAGKEVSSEMID